MVKKIALVVGCILIATVAVIVCLALTKPDEFKAERSIVINAPPEEIFAVIGDFHRFREWSPWEKLDPNLKTSFSGADSGKGAIYSWSGNDEVGEGRMEILEYDPPKKGGTSTSTSSNRWKGITPLSTCSSRRATRPR